MKTEKRVTCLLTAASAVLGCLMVCPALAKEAGEKPNILFIAIDDLRPELGCYGADHIKSPNIDKLAEQGVLFKRAYCQGPVCGTSRSSLMSGVHTLSYPGYAAPWSSKKLAPGKITLPAVFRQAGYYTIGNGKIYHRKEDGANSWSEPAFSLGGHGKTHDPDSANYVGGKGNRGPFFEVPDVPDNTYLDGQTCEKTIKDMRRLAAMDKPFFLACGFIRPHLPFYAPKKYWDLYDREKLVLADNRDRPKNAPKALRGSGEVLMYHDRGIKYNSTEFHKVARHGYYACASYVDALVGKLLATLDELDLRDNTIVVLWGDHGWNLGEHNFWSKHNLLHTAKITPLIICAPGFKKNARTESIVELLDIYPTLCELTGIKVPEHVEGKSMVTLLKNPEQDWKKPAFTKYHGGISIVTADYSYTEWSGGKQRMLFDLKKDPDENINVAEDPNYKEVVKELSANIKRQGKVKK
jgi:arylsulfatase A-like enzyme